MDAQGDDQTAQAKDAVETQTSGPGLLRRISVSALLAGQREIVLEHEGQDYRLRVTANRKLILTK